MIVVPFVVAHDGKRITSERIRLGEIDREGHTYWDIFSNKDVLLMPEVLRENLREPIGLIAEDMKKVLPFIDKKIVVTVGDIVTKSLEQIGKKPDISVVDFMTRRNHIFHLQQTLLSFFFPGKKIKNKAGTIEQNAVDAYRHKVKQYVTTKHKQTLIIDGEEDLLALPAILFAPLGSVVLYGQFGRGIVINEVTEEKKKEIEELLKKFI